MAGHEEGRDGGMVLLEEGHFEGHNPWDQPIVGELVDCGELDDGLTLGALALCGIAF